MTIRISLNPNPTGAGIFVDSVGVHMMNTKRQSAWTLIFVVTAAFSISMTIKASLQGAEAERNRVPHIATASDYETKEGWASDLRQLETLIRQVCAAPPLTPTPIAPALTTAPPGLSFLGTTEKVADGLGIVLPKHPLLPPTTWAELAATATDMNAQIRDAMLATTELRSDLYAAKLRAKDYVDVAAYAGQTSENPHSSVVLFRDSDGQQRFRYWSWTFEQAPKLWFLEYEARALRLELLLQYVESLRAHGNAVLVSKG
ncbi:MAG TPA: hypothetical protein PKD61_22180 [Polyangiaceae bacterium]|nr:hypothetical protein [Polyangiaceae bacterium]